MRLTVTGDVIDAQRAVRALAGVTSVGGPRASWRSSRRRAGNAHAVPRGGRGGRRAGTPRGRRRAGPRSGVPPPDRPGAARRGRIAAVRARRAADRRQGPPAAVPRPVGADLRDHRAARPRPDLQPADRARRRFHAPMPSSTSTAASWQPCCATTSSAAGQGRCRRRDRLPPKRRPAAVQAGEVDAAFLVPAGLHGGDPGWPPDDDRGRWLARSSGLSTDIARSLASRFGDGVSAVNLSVVTARTWRRHRPTRGEGEPRGRRGERTAVARPGRRHRRPPPARPRDLLHAVDGHPVPVLLGPDRAAQPVRGAPPTARSGGSSPGPCGRGTVLAASSWRVPHRSADDAVLAIATTALIGAAGARLPGSRRSSSRRSSRRSGSRRW